MTLFAPHPSDIPDSGVAAHCPACHKNFNLGNLSHEQKSFLLESTQFHISNQEHSLLLKIREIVNEYPETMHPLLRSKVGKEDSKREMLELVSDSIEPGSFFDRDEVNEFLQQKANSIVEPTPHPSDELVDARINEIPGLREKLANSIFNLFDRIKFLELQLPEYDISPLLVVCDDCELQFLVLDDEFYLSLG